MKKQALLFSVLILVLSACNTPKQLERIKKTMKTIQVQDVRERQILEDDKIFYAGPLIPLLYNKATTSGFSLGNLGFVAGQVSPSRLNFTGIAVYKFGDGISNSVGNTNIYAEGKKLGRLDISANISFPIVHFGESSKEIPNVFRVDQEKQIAYFIFPHVKFMKTIDLRAGIDRDFSAFNSSNKSLSYSINPMNMFNSTDVQINQVNYSARVGISFKRNSNYHSNIQMDDKLCKTAISILQELYVDLRLGIYTQMDGLRSSSGKVLSPKNYLQSNLLGFEVGFKHIYGGSKSVIPNMSVAIGAQPGFHDKAMNGAYLRTILTICYSRHKIQDPLD